jgi:hypothetical protein
MRLRALAFAAMMAGLAVVLQTAPVWLTEPAGYALSIFASLPPAVAAAVYPREAIWACVAAALLCLFISPQEAAVFALTNGIFGLGLGLTARAGLQPLRSILLAAAALFGGMALLTWGLGVAALGEELLDRGMLWTLAAYAGFAMAWSGLFTGLFRVICRRVLKPHRPQAQNAASRP